VKNNFLETIKSLDGKIYHLNYHQKRYESVLKSLGVNSFKNLLNYLNPPKDGLYRCRVVYSKEHIEVSYHQYNKRTIKSLKLVLDDEIDYSFKYVDRREIDALSSLKEDCDDILIVKNSYLTDTSIANIALFKEGLWYTPAKPLLKGTTRERLLDENKILEKDIHVSEISQYSKVALCNAMIDFDIISHDNIREVIC
jgi:4-amino-4-deoxychorismate lyase